MDKETLQKKIESGDTVWVIKFGFCEVLELKLSSEYKINDYGDLVHLIRDFDGYNSCIRTYKEIYHAYDTKEEAEWELEFGNVTRTEKLELPSWKRMQENIDWGIDCANRNWYLLKSRGHSIIRIEDWNSNGIYEKPLTYENYLEACRLCKKLFLGEEL